MSSRSHRSVEPDDSTASEFSLSHPEFPPSRHQLPVKIETKKIISISVATWGHDKREAQKFVEWDYNAAMKSQWILAQKKLF